MKPLTLKQDLQITIVALILLFIGFYLGQNSKQNEIENRAKEIKTETLTQQQLEIVIFGKP